MFENRERAADEHRGDDPITDRERALQTYGRPISRAGIEKVNRTYQTKSE